VAAALADIDESMLLQKAQSCRPEKILSLPNGNLDPGHDTSSCMRL
jgi:hypothetical protein